VKSLQSDCFENVASPIAIHGKRTNRAMKAVVCTKPGEIGIQDVPAPGNVEEGMVMLKVQRVGLCGTDFHIYGGKHPFLQYPRIMGHELSGEVAAIHESSRFAKGDAVIVNPYLPCGECVACRRGKFNCCASISVLGVHDHGGMCEFMLVPELALYPAGSLTPDQGAMVELLAVGAHAVRRAAVKAGQRVLVVGIGPIGLGTALISRLEGAHVTVMDMNQARVAKARDEFGFSRAVIVGAEAKERLAGYTDGEFFDVVIDATGNAKAIEAGFELVAHGGAYVLVSVVKDEITFSDPEFHKREMTLLGSRNATREDFEYVIARIERGELPTDKLHTHSCSLGELPELLPEWSQSPDQVIKAIAEI
jgi:2-desacetyl-2-hydroxyethyl bacteriochlorophyllide A dehydrogenase